MFANFEEMPQVGSCVGYGGQVFTVVGSRDHKCRDGRLETLIVWEALCPDCGRPFLSSTKLQHQYPVRRCDLHKSPGARVRASRGVAYGAQKRGARARVGREVG